MTGQKIIGSQPNPDLDVRGCPYCMSKSCDHLVFGAQDEEYYEILENYGKYPVRDAWNKELERVRIDVLSASIFDELTRICPDGVLSEDLRYVWQTRLRHRRKVPASVKWLIRHAIKHREEWSMSFSVRSYVHKVFERASSHGSAYARHSSGVLDAYWTDYYSESPIQCHEEIIQMMCRDLDFMRSEVVPSYPTCQDVGHRTRYYCESRSMEVGSKIFEVCIRCGHETILELVDRLPTWKS